MNILLLAPPAAGKGTQAEILKEKYHLNHVSTGDLLRNEVNKGTDLGNKLKTIMESGNLVSDDIVLEVLSNYLQRTDNLNLLLDGFPRNIYQAKELDKLLVDRNEKIDYAFLLDVGKEILLDRITGRRLCKSCGAIYNVNIDPLKPKVDTICDKCGNSLIQRKDDNEGTFEIRYQEYEKETKPLVDYYQDKKVLYKVDGSISKEYTTEQIESILNQN